MQNNSSDGRMLRIIVAAVAILIAAGLAAYSFHILPEQVATQMEGFMNTGAPPVPRWMAVLVPFAISTLFAVKSVSEPRSIFISIFGYFINVLFWISN